VGSAAGRSEVGENRASNTPLEGVLEKERIDMWIKTEDGNRIVNLDHADRIEISRTRVDVESVSESVGRSAGSSEAWWIVAFIAGKAERLATIPMAGRNAEVALHEARELLGRLAHRVKAIPDTWREEGIVSVGLESV